MLTADVAADAWVDEALEDERIEPEAVQAVVTQRYGDKVVTADPSDREAEKLATSKGYTVIPAGAFSKDAWSAVKGAEAAKPAGQVTPSPNPNEDSDNLTVMEPENQPEAVRIIAGYAAMLGKRLLDAEVEVRVVNDPTWPFLATYGPRKGGTEGFLTLNYGRLGYKWFELPDNPGIVRHTATEDQIALLIHEFAHHKAPDHLAHEFHSECCRLGAKLAVAAEVDGNSPMWVPTGEPVAA